ncbi:MAG: ATP-dependent RNA helicase [Treponema sp.]|jgi:HrpA-like RNA helicase|nr:ATP-dependent RNA helicase [Treponema sp.]
MNYLDLPVYQHKDLILSALEGNQAVVVESPTGSGKTTQLPVLLRDAGYDKNGIIGVTQPRRIAAMSVSDFIARQLGFKEPGESGCPVGFKMRFEDRTNPGTRIKIMTDGILLQEMKLDPWLSKYGVMVIDEAHERSLNIDFILGLLKRVLEARKEFKVVVSSATINAEVFSEYFGECPVVKIEAQNYPVTLIYDPPLLTAEAAPRGRSGEDRGRAENRPGGVSGNLAEEALLVKIETIVERIVSEKRPGDILIFLPGEKMIKDCMSRLVFSSLGNFLYILPLYGRLGREEQERVFDEAPAGKIKVVISTNIAETSVTIDGITSVIDSGLSKLNYYNPRTYTSSLVESPVSRASANQRKGRAGRTRPGTCYRLYTRRDFENRPLFTTEEIYRTDLSEVVLRMADLGITDYQEFDFISAPDREGIAAAIETLNLLDALERDLSLSKTGKMMTEFPLAPRQSRIIVEAILRYPRVIEETIIAAAFLSTQSPYVLPPGEELDARKAHHGFRDSHGDFVSYLKLYRAWTAAENKAKFCEKNYLDERAMAEIANVAVQLEEIVSAMKIPVLSGGDVEDYLCCVGRGLIQFVCVREDAVRPGKSAGKSAGQSSGRFSREVYRSLTADRITIHPGSVMFSRNREQGRDGPRYIVAGEIVRTTRMYAMSVSPLSLETLGKISPILLAEFGGKQADEKGRRGAEEVSGKARRSGRDFTNAIRIGGEIFPVETIKGKKHVSLAWEKLRAVKEALEGQSPGAERYRGMRGTVVLDGKYTLLAGEKLSLIMTLLPGLEPESAPGLDWPRKENFNSGVSVPDTPAEKRGADQKAAGNLYRLLDRLPLVLRPALWKRRSGKGEAGGELGFIALFTDGGGNYRFRCSRGFHTALNESLASLEALIDELGEDVDVEFKHIVNQTYRRLSDYLQ